MIVPQYWAESSARNRVRGRQVTVRRFGWSDISQQDATANADRRAREALARVVAGEKIAKRELKLPYNGADGVPIREEIISRHGNAIVTRNGYGARCLNTPDVLFADIDFDDSPSLRLKLWVYGLLFVGAVGIAWKMESKLYGLIALVLVGVLGQVMVNTLHRASLRLRGDSEQRARNRITKFIATNPDWHLRLYRTPAGLRVLAMHQTFDPRDPVVVKFFRALSADPVYVRMCLNQKCFRARVSPKPWRIGINMHIRPRPGVWPVRSEALPKRTRWVSSYEQAGRGFASCRFIAAVGASVIHPTAQAVQILHDELCQATSGLPIA